MEAIKTSATNKKIRNILTDLQDKRLIPRPDFQRRLVWNHHHKAEFLRTVLDGLPFPEIYISAGDVNPDTAEGTELLVDGQQRITTIEQYFTGDADLWLGDLPAYRVLEDDRKRAFLEYEIVVRDLGPLPIETVKQVFERINSTKYALNAMELNNARYEGPFKDFGERIAEDEFFDTHRVFKPNDFRRMGDLKFVLTLAATMLGGYFNREDELEAFLQRYNDEFPEDQSLAARLAAAFSFVDDTGIPSSSRAWNKADLLTLLVELDRLLAEGVELDSAVVKERLGRFYEDVTKATRDEQVEDERAVRYARAVRAGSNDRANRLTRGEALRALLSE